MQDARIDFISEGVVRINHLMIRQLGNRTIMLLEVFNHAGNEGAWCPTWAPPKELVDQSTEFSPIVIWPEWSEKPSKCGGLSVQRGDGGVRLRRFEEGAKKWRMVATEPGQALWTISVSRSGKFYASRYFPKQYGKRWYIGGGWSSLEGPQEHYFKSEEELDDGRAWVMDVVAELKTQLQI